MRMKWVNTVNLLEQWLGHGKWQNLNLSLVISLLSVKKLTRDRKVTSYFAERSFCGQRIRNQTPSQATQCSMVTQWSLLECISEIHSVLLWEPQGPQHPDSASLGTGACVVLERRVTKCCHLAVVTDSWMRGWGMGTLKAHPSWCVSHQHSVTPGPGAFTKERCPRGVHVTSQHHKLPCRKPAFTIIHTSCATQDPRRAVLPLISPVPSS